MKRKLSVTSEEDQKRFKFYQSEEFSYEQIASLFHLPINIACLSLNIEVDTLIQRCRDLGIKRWPYNAKKEMNKLKKKEKERTDIPDDKGMFFEFNLGATLSTPTSPVKNVPSLVLPSFKEFLKVTLNE